jgi:uncharacterized protein
MIAENLMLVPVLSRHWRAAARLADRHGPGLRAGDALHLTICADLGATLGTLDRRLGEAGGHLGTSTARP